MRSNIHKYMYVTDSSKFAKRRDPHEQQELWYYLEFPKLQLLNRLFNFGQIVTVLSSEFSSFYERTIIPVVGLPLRTGKSKGG